MTYRRMERDWYYWHFFNGSRHGSDHTGVRIRSTLKYSYCVEAGRRVWESLPGWNCDRLDELFVYDEEG